MSISRQFTSARENLNEKVFHFFYEESLNNKALSLIMNKVNLFDFSNIYAFGGVVRDIELKNKPSDIDLVFNGYRDDFDLLIESLNGERIIKNKFGGFRIETSQLDIDLWFFKDTWALLNNKIDDTNNRIDDLLKTTFFNWDAVLFDFKNKDIICDKYYYQCLNNRHLDINLVDNPNTLGSFSRIIKNIFHNNAIYLSEEIVNYLEKSFSDYSFSEIREFYLSKNQEYDLQLRNLISLYDRVNTRIEYSTKLKSTIEVDK
ncbi:hypothetical protein [Proteus hauseri]|uniref:hypothetical protein n=1 Tax=Proteus hauseri TaxID=183417 RepID=UPI0032DA9927